MKMMLTKKVNPERRSTTNTGNKNVLYRIRVAGDIKC